MTSAVAARGAPAVERLRVSAYTVPTDAPEADGTIAWESTTMVLVEIESGGERGIGYTYADASAARFIRDILEPVVSGMSAMDIPAAWDAMLRASRNAGRPGVGAMAISAVDTALWDLKAKLLGLPLARLFGMARQEIAVYGSGGFTSYDDTRLSEQLGGWAEDGLRFVKMKVGSDPADDLRRVRVARRAIGGNTALFVDANGAYTRKQALDFAERFADEYVAWFEEPVSSDDLAGLRLIRDRAPARMDIAAGEYGFDPWYFRAMLEAGAVDVLQADATRCLGYTGFLRAAALADAFQVPLSSHCAPALHLPVMLAAPRAAHMEWFHDHVRIERMFFEGASGVVSGAVLADLDRPGIGLELRRADAERYAIQ